MSILKLEMKYIHEIAQCLSNNHATVMIGSGFSKNATPSSSLVAKTFPDWNELADSFLEKLNYNEEGRISRYLSPLALAEEVEALFGRNVLNRILIDSIPDTEYNPSTIHKKLLELPWKDIFTTNYDTLLERTCEEIPDKRYNIINCSDDLINSADTTRIIKLHGTFPSYRPFIITREDYRTYPRLFASFVNTVQQSLIENTLCLIGFSGDDPNFLQWIGWIHDNLGKSNTKKIYLITAGNETDARKKILFDKNIISVNLNQIWPDCNYKICIEKFMDILIDETQKSTEKAKWIDKTFMKKLSDLDLISSIALLRELHSTYPGWIVIPYSKKDIINYFFRELDRIILNIKDDEIKDVVSFWMDYLWLSRVAARPIFKTNLQHLEKVYDTILSYNNEDTTKIELSLLKIYRELSENQKWNEIFEKLRCKKLTQVEENEFQYEKCMHSFYLLDIKTLKEELSAWEVSENDYLWTIKKNGLLAELGELHTAKASTQKSINIVRRQIARERLNFNYEIYSIENCMVSFLNYISQSINAREMNFNNNFVKPLSISSDTIFDWHSENEHYEMILTENYTPQKTNEYISGFDLGTYTIASHFANEDTEALTAFQYIRFREETGIPFRIGNITNYKGTLGAIRRIAPYNSYLCALVAIRCNKKEYISEIYNRVSIATYSSDDIDEICKIYINITHTLIGEVSKKNWFNPTGTFDFAADVLPEMISRLCPKCSIDVLDEILNLLFAIYISENKMCFKNISKLMTRLLNSYSISERISRLIIFIKFPVQNKQTREYNEYPDPITLCNCKDMKADNNVIISQHIDNMFELAKQSEFTYSAMERLIALSYIIKMESSHKQKFINLLWQDSELCKLPSTYGYSKSILIDYPRPSFNIEELIVEEYISIFDDISKKSGVSSGNHIYTDAVNLASKGLFDNVNLNSFVEICFNFSQKYRNYINREIDFLDIHTEVIHHLSSIFYILARILLSHYKSKAYISDNISNIISELLVFSDEYGIPCSLLRIVVKNCLNNEILAKNYLISKIISADREIYIDAMETLNELLKLDIGLEINNIIDKTLEFIVNIILLSDGEKTISALNVFCYFLKSNNHITDEFLSYIDFALINIATITIIEENDSESVANLKCNLRKTAARLAFYLNKRYENIYPTILNSVQIWNKICSNKNEYAEIRNEWYNNEIVDTYL